MEIESYFKLVLLLGAAFIFLLSMYLMFYPNKFFANKVLGALTFSWSITVFGFILQSPDFFAKYPHLFGTLDVCTLLFFPLMFIYIKTYLYKDARHFFKGIVHYIPAVLYILIFMPFFVLDADTKVNMYPDKLPSWFRPMQNVFNVVIILQGIFYTIISLRTLHHFQYFRTRRLSQFQLSSLNWLKLFVISNVVLWIIGTTGAFLGIFGIAILIDLFDVFYLGLTILTLLLGVFTIQRPELFAEEEDIRKLSISKQVDIPKDADRANDTEGYELLLNYLKNEKPYLKNDLKMQDLVEGTGLSYKRISEMFNNEFKKSFFDVVNEYRLETAINLIKEGFHKQHTLPHLAEKAGFNSKTTFNRIFKKYTGQTPSEYIQSQK